MTADFLLVRQKDDDLQDKAGRFEGQKRGAQLDEMSRSIAANHHQSN